MERDGKLTLDLRDQDTWDMIWFLKKECKEERKSEYPILSKIERTR